MLLEDGFGQVLALLLGQRFGLVRLEQGEACVRFHPRTISAAWASASSAGSFCRTFRFVSIFFSKSNSDLTARAVPGTAGR